MGSTDAMQKSVSGYDVEVQYNKYIGIYGFKDALLYCFGLSQDLQVYYNKHVRLMIKLQMQVHISKCKLDFYRNFAYLNILFRCTLLLMVCIDKNVGFYFPNWRTAYLLPTARRPQKLILTAWQAACPDFCWCVHRAAPRDLRPLRINPVEDVHPVAGDPPGLHAMTTCVRTLGGEIININTAIIES